MRRFSDLTEKEKKEFIPMFSVLPFPEYAIHKALTEVNPEIYYSDLDVEAWVVHPGWIKRFFHTLVTNADLR